MRREISRISVVLPEIANIAEIYVSDDIDIECRGENNSEGVEFIPGIKDFPKVVDSILLWRKSILVTDFWDNLMRCIKIRKKLKVIF
jgi:hypothetical protein